MGTEIIVASLLGFFGILTFLMKFLSIKKIEKKIEDEVVGVEKDIKIIKEDVKNIVIAKGKLTGSDWKGIRARIKELEISTAEHRINIAEIKKDISSTRELLEVKLDHVLESWEITQQNIESMVSGGVAPCKQFMESTKKKKI